MDVAGMDVHVKSKRPSDSNFKQQRLPSWQPVLTAGTVLPTFFIIGIAFIPVGVALLYFSNNIAEHVIDYTRCLKIVDGNALNVTCADEIRNNPHSYSRDNPCECAIEFNLDKDFVGDVYMYYGLSNFYQNHRRYVKSRDDNQLLGEFTTPVSSDCIPFDSNANGQAIVPCGAIANSLFNDTLDLKSISNGIVPVLNTGIAWPSDKEIKFRNPPGDLRTALQGFARPIAWTRELWDLDTENAGNNGLQNEDLIVWMRTAALPSFRKLYRRVNYERNSRFDGMLPRGRYVLNVKYHYPVTQFDGTKSFILSTTSILGGKNPFLGYAYIVVGSICLFLGFILLFVHLKYRREARPVTTSTPYT